jgi:hypothetical protein
MAPAIAVLGPLRREGQHVVGCIANRAQDGPVLDREGLGQFLGEVRTRQRHATYLDGLGRESSLPRIRACSDVTASRRPSSFEHPGDQIRE